MPFSAIVFYLDKNNIEYEINKKTSSLVSYKVGGEAKIIAYPSKIDELCNLIVKIKENKIRFFLLGNGTNTYFSDRGFDGVIVSTKKLNRIIVSGNRITAMCGALINNICLSALSNSLSGMEFMYGIPGSVGGAVYMNAEAYEKSISEIVEKSLIFDTGTLKYIDFSNKDHSFSKKSSIFARNHNLLVLETSIILKQSNREEISLKMNDLIQKRIKSQPLNLPNAGSVFKRPKNNYASRLVDDAGLKGFRIGGAEVSKKHAGFIVNTGNATATDIYTLTNKIKEIIKYKFGIELVEEIIYVE